MKVVRDSKFRHVHADALKTRYDDLRLSSKATESSGIRANSKFFTFAWDSGGGGALAVIPLTRTGRLPRDLPLITGHTGPILDFEFSPFDENMLLSASEDLTLKVWQIPDEGLKQHLREPFLNLEGHGKKVSFSTFNPSAANIFASASFDMTIKVWDLVEQAEAFSIPVPENVMHLKWNGTGSLLAATCKDKKLRIYDPRQQKVVGEQKVHDGVKAAKVEWMTGHAAGTEQSYKLFTTGFSSQAEREVGYWDMRKFASNEGADGTSLQMYQLDQGTGVLFPFFDPGAQMLYLAGKGDGNVRFFEVTAEDPFLHYISDYRSTVPQKGFDFLPKRCVDVMSHEIMRGLKLESTGVQPVSFKVPRKSEAFQEDLFPDCPAGVPAIAADEWVAGSVERLPITRPMKPGEAQEAVKAAAAPAVVSVKDLKKQLAEAQERIKALEKENESLKAELAAAKA